MLNIKYDIVGSFLRPSQIIKEKRWLITTIFFFVLTILKPQAAI
jgi:hypothetical protein